MSKAKTWVNLFDAPTTASVEGALAECEAARDDLVAASGGVINLWCAGGGVRASRSARA